MDINRDGLVKQLMEKHNYTKGAASAVVDDFTAIILDNMRDGNTVSLYGFGCFDILQRAARSCPNPQTGELCQIPPHQIPRFYPGKRMRKAVALWEDDVNRGLK